MGKKLAFSPASMLLFLFVLPSQAWPWNHWWPSPKPSHKPRHKPAGGSGCRGPFPDHPDCEAHLDWVVKNWRQYPKFKDHGVNGSRCSIQKYLSTIEHWCPPVGGSPPSPPPPSPPSPGPQPSSGPGICTPASDTNGWPFSSNRGWAHSCRSSRGGTNDLGTHAHMCSGDKASVYIKLTKGKAECLEARAYDCKIPIRTFKSMDYDLAVSGCMGAWAAPLWLTPTKWQWDGKSGEIDSTEFCPRTGIHMNFAGGGHQVDSGFSIDNSNFHITVYKDEAGIVTINSCTLAEAKANGNQCPKPSYNGCADCKRSNKFSCWCEGSRNIYESGACSNGGDCHWTLVSDIWNGVGGDAGYTGCMGYVRGVVGRMKPNYNSECAFSVTNIRIRGSGQNGRIQWGPGSSSTCSVLTP